MWSFFENKVGLINDWRSISRNFGSDVSADAHVQSFSRDPGLIVDPSTNLYRELGTLASRPAPRLEHVLGSVASPRLSSHRFTFYVACTLPQQDATPGPVHCTPSPARTETTVPSSPAKWWSDPGLQPRAEDRRAFCRPSESENKQASWRNSRSVGSGRARFRDP